MKCNTELSKPDNYYARRMKNFTLIILVLFCIMVLVAAKDSPKNRKMLEDATAAAVENAGRKVHSWNGKNILRSLIG